MPVRSATRLRAGSLLLFSGRYVRGYATKSVATTASARAILLNRLQAISKHAEGHARFNQARVHLAINNLQQRAGEETVRVAILGVPQGDGGKTARELVRGLLADPLVEEQAWEGKLERHDVAKPLVVRIGKVGEASQKLIAQEGSVEEVVVDVPGWDKHNIELLFVEDARLAGHGAEGISEGRLLTVPTIIQGKQVETPVHKAVAVASGLSGVAAVGRISALGKSKDVVAAINLAGYKESTESTSPIKTVDVSSGLRGVELFRESPGNGMQYEHLWSQSNLPSLRAWILDGAQSTPDSTKPAVRELITSVLKEAEVGLFAQSTTKSPEPVSAPQTTTPEKKESPELKSLKNGLYSWSETAHTELQTSLDAAFTGPQWRKLKWWKLFWHVDDVSVLTSEILHQRFLPRSNRDLIFLAGRISQPLHNGAIAFNQPKSLVVVSPTDTPTPRDPITPEEAARQVPKWPTHIDFTRNYLFSQTVPALHALAQRLVFQTAGSTGLSGVLGGLLYASQFSVYEAGAAAAMGSVVALGVMQRRWEEARRFSVQSGSRDFC